MRRFAMKALFAALTLNKAEKRHMDWDRVVLIVIDVRDRRAGDALCVRESDVALVVAGALGAGEFPSNRFPLYRFG